MVERSRCGYGVGVEPKYFLGKLVEKAKSVAKGAVSRAKRWLSGTHRGVTVARALLGRTRSLAAPRGDNDLTSSRSSAGRSLPAYMGMQGILFPS